jgi:hypothetical protein
MSRRLVALSFVVLLSACSIAARRAAALPATTQATTSATHTVKLSDAVPLNRFRGDHTDVDLRQHIAFDNGEGRGSGGGGGNDFYFGQCDTLDDNGETAATEPLVVAKVRGGWGAITLKDDRLANAEWQFVASGPAAGEIWGVLDDTLTARGKVLLLAHSTDAGETWGVTAIGKPFGAGESDSYCTDKTGRGRLTVYVAGDRRHRARGGYYHLRTTDGGVTWSAPEHEPDALDPAEEVPDTGDDPEPLRESPLRSVQYSQANRR